MTKDEIHQEYKNHFNGDWFKKRLKFIFKVPKNIKYRISQNSIAMWITDGEHPVAGTSVEIYLNTMKPEEDPTMNLSSMSFNPSEHNYHCQRIQLQADLINNWAQVKELCFKASKELIKLENRYQEMNSNSDK